MEIKATSRAENAEQWRGRVERSERHEGSMQSFCEAEGVSLSALQYWRQKLGQPRDAAVTRSAFVPVQIVGGPDGRAGYGLPDPKWVAEIILRLSEGTR